MPWTTGSGRFWNSPLRYVLAGDIGGSKVNLALYERHEGQLSLRKSSSFISKNFSTLEAVLEAFFSGEKQIVDGACFGIAGPVESGQCKTTNLPWVVEAVGLKKFLATGNVWLINDLASLACAVPFLGESEVEVLQEGKPEPSGRVAVIAAGTGLGQAFLIPEEQGRYRVVDSEGGHCDFPFLNDLEGDLCRFMKQKYGRVSIERVVSGEGLAQIYQFVKRHYSFEETGTLAEEMQTQDPASVIARHGMEAKSEACQKALDLFISFYGRVAGNLALQIMARGGVYVGGGIAPKILARIRKGLFMESFLSKGRFKDFMARIPVKVIKDDQSSLRGAAHYALGERFFR